MDQLLFGTMLFTLLAFLFPTVLAYYSLFAIVRFLGIKRRPLINIFCHCWQLRFVSIMLHACLDILLAFMNHFPLFALTLRVKDPWRLPGTHSSMVSVSPVATHLSVLINPGGVYFATSTASRAKYPSLILMVSAPFRALMLYIWKSLTESTCSAVVHLLPTQSVFYLWSLSVS
jgi:phosphatidylinositol N-acetylglucosaminyltransferase subunit Q